MIFKGKDKVRKELFEGIPNDFVDPITRLPPASETQLSALLCLFHLWGKINWSKIKLYSLDNTFSGQTADHLITDSKTLCCEYPLFASTKEQISIWGQMAADILYYSREEDRVVLIENKIGSNFTSGGDDLDYGQLARQIEYLIQNSAKDKNILLLSSKQFFDKGWYLTELSNTLRYKNAKEIVGGYLVYWEEIFSSFSTA